MAQEMSNFSQKNEIKSVERVIAYIDGFNLYFGLREAGLRKHYWLDVLGLSRSLLRPGQELVGLKYFSARVKPTARDPHQHQRQKTYLEALETLDLTTLIFGHYLDKTVTCRSCSATWSKPEEKMTDVNIAMEMLADAFTNKLDTVLLISGDSDLTGPIQKVRQLAGGKRVVVAFPPKRVSERLKREANGWLHIGHDKIRQNQLPDKITKPDGIILVKPPELV